MRQRDTTHGHDLHGMDAAKTSKINIKGKFRGLHTPKIKMPVGRGQIEDPVPLIRPTFIGVN